MSQNLSLVILVYGLFPSRFAIKDIEGKLSID